MRLSWRGFPVFAWFEASRILAERAHVWPNRACAAKWISASGSYPGRPCILAVSATVWSAIRRFRCASPRTQAARNAAPCSGEREYAIGGRRGKTRSFGQRFRPKRRAGPVRTRACERGQREPHVDIRSPKRLATLCISTVSVSTRSSGEPLPAWISRWSHSPRYASVIASEDAHACGYPASRITRSAVVFNGEGARVAGRQCRIGRG